MRLKNKTILVTGSTTGIGEAIARYCIAEGAFVMIHGRCEEKAKKICDELGSNAQYVVAALNHPAAYADIINKTVDTFGGLHGLVNNAGIFPRSNIDSSHSHLFDDIMTINLKAPLMLCREAVRIFRQQKSAGSIVNIGSINAYCGQPDLLVYSISKGGLMTLTRNLADALGTENIRVNQLNVGWTPTESEDRLKQREGFPKDWQSMIPPMYAPRGCLLTPQEVAGHVMFWLSDESAPVSGVVYEVEQYPIMGRNRICDMQLHDGRIMEKHCPERV